MTPIIFKVTRSKVKVTVAFNAKTVSAQYSQNSLAVNEHMNSEIKLQFIERLILRAYNVPTCGALVNINMPKTC